MAAILLCNATVSRILQRWWKIEIHISRKCYYCCCFYPSSRCTAKCNHSIKHDYYTVGHVRKPQDGRNLHKVTSRTEQANAAEMDI